jgi:hypothetical protein
MLGEYAFSDCKFLESVRFGDTCYLLNVIPAHCFDKTAIASISIPDSVITIGDSAFEWCTRLSSVRFRDNSQLETIGARAFAVTALRAFHFPGRVSEIGAEAFLTTLSQLTVVDFGDCEILEIPARAFNFARIAQIVIPDSVARISELAFADCPDLVSVTFGPKPTLQIIEKSAFQGSKIETITLPLTVESIGESAFEHCLLLTSVTLSDSLYSRLSRCGARAFRGCENLREVFGGRYSLEVIPDELFASTGIEEMKVGRETAVICVRAFGRCTKLKNVEFADGSRLREIQEGAFTDCLSLEWIGFFPRRGTAGMPQLLSKVADNCFARCVSLKQFDFTFICEIGKCAFYDSGLTEGPTNKSIPISVISDRAFHNCRDLSKCNIQSSTATEIGAFSFSCTAVTVLRISASVTKICESAFEGCDRLQGLVFPSGNQLKVIERRAFFKSLLVSGLRGDLDHLEVIGAEAFGETKLASFTVPASVREIDPTAFDRLTYLTKLSR